MTKTVTLPIEEYEALMNADGLVREAKGMMAKAERKREEAYRVQEDAQNNYNDTWFLKVVAGFAIGFFVSKFFF